MWALGSQFNKLDIEEFVGVHVLPFIVIPIQTYII